MKITNPQVKLLEYSHYYIDENGNCIFPKIPPKKVPVIIPLGIFRRLMIIDEDTGELFQSLKHYCEVHELNACDKSDLRYLLSLDGSWNTSGLIYIKDYPHVMV